MKYLCVCATTRWFVSTICVCVLCFHRHAPPIPIYYIVLFTFKTFIIIVTCVSVALQLCGANCYGIQMKLMPHQTDNARNCIRRLELFLLILTKFRIIYLELLLGRSPSSSNLLILDMPRNCTLNLSRDLPRHPPIDSSPKSSVKLQIYF